MTIFEKNAKKEFFPICIRYILEATKACKAPERIVKQPLYIKKRMKKDFANQLGSD